MSIRTIQTRGLKGCKIETHIGQTNSMGRDMWNVRARLYDADGTLVHEIVPRVHRAAPALLDALSLGTEHVERLKLSAEQRNAPYPSDGSGSEVNYHLNESCHDDGKAAMSVFLTMDWEPELQFDHDTPVPTDPSELSVRMGILFKDCSREDILSEHVGYAWGYHEAASLWRQYVFKHGLLEKLKNLAGEHDRSL